MARGRPQVTFNKGHKVLPSMFFRATTSPVLYHRQLDKRCRSHISPLLPKNHFYWSHHIGLEPKSKLHLSTAPRPLNVLRTIGNITPLVNHKNPSEEMWDLEFGFQTIRKIENPTSPQNDVCTKMILEWFGEIFFIWCKWWIYERFFKVLCGRVLLWKWIFQWQSKSKHFLIYPFFTETGLAWAVK